MRHDLRREKVDPPGTTLGKMKKKFEVKRWNRECDESPYSLCPMLRMRVTRSTQHFSCLKTPPPPLTRCEPSHMSGWILISAIKCWMNFDPSRVRSAQTNSPLMISLVTSINNDYDWWRSWAGQSRSISAAVEADLLQIRKREGRTT